MDESYRINREIVTEFFFFFFHTHTDWTGTYVETQYKCDSVEKFIDKFMDYIRENGAD